MIESVSGPPTLSESSVTCHLPLSSALAVCRWPPIVTIDILARIGRAPHAVLLPLLQHHVIGE